MRTGSLFAGQRAKAQLRKTRCAAGSRQMNGGNRRGNAGRIGVKAKAAANHGCARTDGRRRRRTGFVADSFSSVTERAAWVWITCQLVCIESKDRVGKWAHHAGPQTFQVEAVQSRR